jgi:hypothetical protein
MSTIRSTSIPQIAVTITGDTTGILNIESENNMVNAGNVTGGIFVPSGTTAERPATPQAGMLRYNTTTNKFEMYAGTSWVSFG